MPKKIIEILTNIILWITIFIAREIYVRQDTLFKELEDIKIRVSIIETKLSPHH